MNRCRDGSRRSFVSPSKEDIGHIGLDCVCGDDHSLKHLMGSELKKDPVLECAGFHLIGIADEVLRSRHIHRNEAPFQTGRKTCATTSPEV
jgi:hypothetical protein